MTAEEMARYSASQAGRTIRDTGTGIETTSFNYSTDGDPRRWEQSDTVGAYLVQSRNPISNLGAQVRVAIDKAINDPKNQPDQPSKGATYCNIAVADMANYLGLENASSYKGKRADPILEMLVGDHDTVGTKSARTAQAQANLGVFVVAGRLSNGADGASGHIGAVVPSYVPNGPVILGQAGSRNGYFTA